MNSGGRPERKHPEPPHSTGAERAVLGSILRDPSVFPDIRETLPGESAFYLPKHKAIYRAMCDVVDGSQQVDIVSVVNAGGIERTGGRTYLVELLEDVVSAGNARELAHVLVDYHVRRSLLAGMNNILSAAYDTYNNDPSELLSQASSLIADLINMRSGGGGVVPIKDVVPDVLDWIGQLQSKDAPSGLRFGFPDVDRMVLGLYPGDLLVVAGRPSMGKTAFMTCAALNAIKGGEKVLFFSGEMEQRYIGLRILATEARVDTTRIRRGLLTDGEWKQINRAFNRLSGANLGVDSTTGIDVDVLCGRIQNLASTGDIGAVFVDYLQKLTTNKNFGGNLRAEITYMIARLKQVAIKAKVPVIVGCQLSRSVEDRKDKRPTLRDLKETGKIEEESDIVLGLYRPERYAKEPKQYEGQAEIIVLKNRNGVCGTVDMYYDAPFTRYESLTEESRDESRTEA